MRRFALVLAMCGIAHAEPTADAKKHAGELAVESQQHYKRGEFEVAVALLRQAYALYPQPNLLYNLGRALESMNDKQGAVDAYKQYLASADQVEDRGAIERRVTTLQTEIDAAKAKPVEPAPPVKPIETPPVVQAPIVVQPPPPAPERETSIAPWITMGIGVAIGGAGIGFALDARDQHQKAIDASIGADAKVYDDNAHRNALVANIGFAVGGAVVIGGLVWLIVDRHHAPKDVAVRVTHSSGMLAWTF
ncbi:MAG: tetratricopeptide repeat protein [Kofleriaceae bacterium]